MRTLYPAVIEKEADSDYGIFFPDFPGCVSAGKSPEEALAMGAEALSLHVAGMVSDKDPIPTPTPVLNIKLDADIQVVCITMVPVIIPGRSVRINVTLDEHLIEEIDAVTSNRSRFLAEAAQERLRQM